MGIQIGIGLTGQRVGFSPASLFAVSGSRGFMYDLSNYSTQFQDTAGTVPITSTAQSLARVNDLSGLGNHATQPTAGSCPTTTTIGAGFRGIQFDGIDDWLQTAAIDFSNSDEVTVVAGVRKLSDAARGVLVELGTNLTGNGRFNIEAPSSVVNDFAFSSGGSGFQAAGVTAAAPATRVISGQAKISTDTLTIRSNGSAAGSSALDQGTGNYNIQPVWIGRRGGTSLPYNGVLTFLFVINRLLTANELAFVEAYANVRTGAY